jgi:hypothetical protein
MAQTDTTMGLDDIRIQEFVPISGPEIGRVLIVPSGRVGPMDQGGFESELYERLAGRLVASGMVTIRFDAEADKPRGGVSMPARRANRTRRLSDILNHEAVAARRSPLVLLGVSLGALSIVDLLSCPNSLQIRAAVLVGCVIEEPSVVMLPVERIDFIYGARDLVGYRDSDGRLSEICGPEEYGTRSADQLIVLPRTVVTTRIIEGVGHTMARPGAHAPDDDTLDVIVNATKQSVFRQSGMAVH